MAEIGRNIKAIREGQGLSQSEIEKRSGIKREYLSKIENEELKNPTVDTVKKLASAIGVPITTIFEYSKTGNDAEVLRENNKKIEGQLKEIRKKVQGHENVINNSLKAMSSLKIEEAFLRSQILKGE